MAESSILFEERHKIVAFPVVVSGPSGAGKTSLCYRVVADCPDVVYSVSATTRPRREEETDGKDYHFVAPDKFLEMAKAGDLLECAEVHDCRYGTPKSSVLPFLDKGKIVIMDIDVQGGLSMRKAFPCGVFVFVVPPSFEVLERRLRARRTDSADALETRLRNAREEMKYRAHYDYLVVNDDFDTTLARLKSIISAEKCRMLRLFD
ncbi:MAG: guanylate kinase [Candidatus Eisenbacteria bacterium]